MALKIAQITLGDLRIIQLDDSPIASGYDAPKTSLALYNSELFIKNSALGGLATDWGKFISPVGELHKLSGNINPNAVAMLMGSLVGSNVLGLDVKLVRDSIEQISLLANADTDFRPAKIKLLEGLEISKRIVNLPNEYGTPYYITGDQGLNIFVPTLGLVGINDIAIGKMIANNASLTDVVAFDMRLGKVLQAIYANATETIDIENINVAFNEDAKFKKFRVTILGYHSLAKASTNFAFVKEVFVRIDEANNDHFVTFQIDAHTYEQDALGRNFQIAISNVDANTKKFQVVMSDHNQAVEMVFAVHVEELAVCFNY